MEKDIIKFFDKDRFAHFAGIELTKVGKGYAETSLDLSEKHLNGLDGVHGGVIFTLADFAFAAATNSDGSATVAINSNITYFKAPKGNRITAVAKETSAGKKICGCDVDVLDEDGTLIAKLSGTGYRKGLKIDFATGILTKIK